jgi:hypothetical protein
MSTSSAARVSTRAQLCVTSEYSRAVARFFKDDSTWFDSERAPGGLWSQTKALRKSTTWAEWSQRGTVVEGGADG